MGIVNKVKHGAPKATTADPVLTRLVEEDKVSWIRKPNLRSLYFLLVPAAIGIEITSGFDSQLINALQIVPTWITCKFSLGRVCRVQQLTSCRQISTNRKVLSRVLLLRRTPSVPFSRCHSFLWLIAGSDVAGLS